MLAIGSKGQSLVQVLVVLGISVVGMMIIAQIMTNQSRQAQALQQKMAALDFQRTFSTAMSDNTACSYQLSTVNPNLTFDATNVSTTNPQTIDLGANAKIYLSGTTNSPVLAQISTAANGFLPSILSNSLKVSAIKLIVTGGTGTPPGPPFLAHYEIDWDNTSLVMPIQPAKYNVMLTTSGTGAATQVTGCSGGVGVGTTSGTGQMCGWCTVNNSGTPPNTSQYGTNVSQNIPCNGQLICQLWATCDDPFCAGRPAPTTGYLKAISCPAGYTDTIVINGMTQTMVNTGGKTTTGSAPFYTHSCVQ